MLFNSYFAHLKLIFEKYLEVPGKFRALAHLKT